jgi:hypothetical protein
MLETTDFGSWTQTLMTQMKDRLGVEPKRHWPYAKRQLVDWVVRATMDHGMNKHTQDYTLLHIHVRWMIWLLHYQCTHCNKLTYRFKLFITWLKILKQVIKTTRDPGTTLEVIFYGDCAQIQHDQCIQPPNHMWVFREERFAQREICTCAAIVCR